MTLEISQERLDQLATEEFDGEDVALALLTFGERMDDAGRNDLVGETVRLQQESG